MAGRQNKNLIFLEQKKKAVVPGKMTFETGKTDRAVIKKKRSNRDFPSQINDPKGKTVAVIEIVRVVK